MDSVTFKSHPCLHEGTSGSQMPNWNLQRRSNVTKMLVVAPPILPPPFLLKDLKFEKSSNGSNGSLPTNDLHMTKKLTRAWLLSWSFLKAFLQLAKQNKYSTFRCVCNAWIATPSHSKEGVGDLFNVDSLIQNLKSWHHNTPVRLCIGVLHLDHFCLYFAVGYFMQGPQGLNQQFIDRNSAKKKGKQQVPKKRKVSNTWWLCNLWCDI